MSDPSVSAMTEAQWLFEYEALRAKETSAIRTAGEMLKTLVRALREVLIGVLGLGLIKQWKTEDPVAKAALTDITPFVPASFLWSRPEQLKTFLDDMKKDDDAQAGMSDAEFDAWSLKLARGETGDMDPLILGTPGDDLNAYWRSEAAQQALQTLGVRPRVSGRTVPHVEKKPKQLGPGHPVLKVTLDDDEEEGAAGG